uniref:Uncharacterized protein n=1 Tax=Rhizophora mucronata TaxID=61149 RepID=A0A2P2J4S2_RHIMU
MILQLFHSDVNETTTTCASCQHLVLYERKQH